MLNSICNLKKQLNMICSAILSNRFDLDTVLQLTSYYDVILEIIKKIYGREIVTKAEIFFDSDILNRCLSLKDKYWDKFAKNLINNKNFHNSYFNEILNCIDDVKYIHCDVELSQKDFFELINIFLKTINQGELFDKLYKSGSIYQFKNLDNDSLGFTIYNPLNNKNLIFIEDEPFNISSLVTTIHELGHCFDIDNLKANSKDYNKYCCLSVYSEVIARLFERLLLKFLLKENIYYNEARSSYIYFLLNNKALMTQANWISSLNDERLLDLLYTDDDYKLSDEFVDRKDIDKKTIKLLKQLDHINIKDSFCYTYGDILSMFLCDDIEKNGFSLDILKDFMNNRTNLFDENYILESGFSPYEYVKLYNNEIQFIKK